MIPSLGTWDELLLEARVTDAGDIRGSVRVSESWPVWRRQILAGVTTLTNYDELHKLTI